MLCEIIKHQKKNAVLFWCFLNNRTTPGVLKKTPERKDAVKKKHHREKKTKAAEEFKETTNLALLKSNNLFVLKKKNPLSFVSKPNGICFMLVAQLDRAPNYGFGG